MELTPDIQLLIEQYLNGQLSGQALQAFEERLAAEEALTAEVDFQRKMHHFLADSPENDLRKTLQMLSDQVVEPKKKVDKAWFWWLFPENGTTNVLDWLFGQPQRHLAWLLPLLLLAGWWLTSQRTIPAQGDNLVNNDSIKSGLEASPISSPIESPINPIVEEEDTLEQPTFPINREIEKPKTNPIKEPYVNQEKPTPLPPKKDKIIPPNIKEEDLVPERTVQTPSDDTAKVLNIEPRIPSLGETMSSLPPPPEEYYTHPILHPMMQRNEGAFQMKPDSSIFNFVIESENELTNFYFVGQIAQRKRIAKKGLQFHLFSNQAEDYEYFEPITSLSLKGQVINKERYQYEVQQQFDLAPARYYFIIQDHEGKDFYYIGDFTVIVEE